MDTLASGPQRKTPSTRLDISLRPGNARDFELWRYGLSPLYETDAPDTAARASFAGEMTSYHFADIGIARGWSSAANFVRTPLTIARGGLDNVCLLVYSEGGCAFTSERDAVEVHPGDICFIDLTRQSALKAPNFRNLSVVLPRALLAPLIADRDGLHGRILKRSTPLNAMLAGHLRTLFDTAPDLSLKDAGVAAHGTAALVAAFAGASAHGRDAIEQASASATLQTARRLIETNLHEPDLGPEFVCRRLGMSRAKLYRLFEPIGGVGEFIQQRRLARAYQALTDPAHENVYISAVAAQCGFGNASVFSRAFRNAFGISPTDLRGNHQRTDKDEGVFGDNAFAIMRRQLLGMGSQAG